MKMLLTELKSFLRHLPFIGKGRDCPVCTKSSKKFEKAGIVPREDARCMYCNALERHRLTWLFFKNRTDLFNGHAKRMLHVAPEEPFEKLLKKKIGIGYLTADLYNPAAMVKMDISDIQFDDETFDVIYCSHVLEHVSNDKRAIKEFYRVLKTSGWAILLVPITAAKTFEDPLVTDPMERLKLFGQEDHVRCYGPDYAERLAEGGFVVEIVKPKDFLGSEEIERMGITDSAGEIYFCRKS
jgi:SAM-dependent methyltransferase